MFRRVKIQPISLPEADQVRIVCCQIVLGTKSNVFFGPHTFDLMSLDGNCQRNRVSLHLPHVTPCATPESSGTNVFAHSLPLDHNIFVRYLLE